MGRARRARSRRRSHSSSCWREQESTRDPPPLRVGHRGLSAYLTVLDPLYFTGFSSTLLTCSSPSRTDTTDRRRTAHASFNPRCSSPLPTDPTVIASHQPLGATTHSTPPPKPEPAQRRPTACCARPSNRPHSDGSLNPNLPKNRSSLNNFAALFVLTASAIRAWKVGFKVVCIKLCKIGVGGRRMYRALLRAQRGTSAFAAGARQAQSEDVSVPARSNALDAWLRPWPACPAS